MAKNMIAREVKRGACQQLRRRAELKATIANKDLDPSERFMAVLKLQKLPRDSSRIRMHNRCIRPPTRGLPSFQHSPYCPA